ncbi:hypothetical protein BC830DRAFT_93099 [Chytriomyces sp. MP71]|nr:hypothetical protein BC830DRAFT_93099 [Chytriomyces sp. MP71]
MLQRMRSGMEGFTQLDARQQRIVVAAVVGVVSVAVAVGMLAASAAQRSAQRRRAASEAQKRREQRRRRVDCDPFAPAAVAEEFCDSPFGQRRGAAPVAEGADTLLLRHARANGFGADAANAALNADTVRAIVARILDAPAVQPPVTAFKDVVGGTSGKPAAHHASALAIRESTPLPPFTAQIAHINAELKGAKTRGRPLLLEGPPGLGKGTALMNYLAEEAELRPALYLQLSKVLRKRHGSSSLDDDDDFIEGETGTQASMHTTDTETEMEGEERVLLTVRRDAILRGLYEILGYDCTPIRDSETDVDMEDVSTDSPTQQDQETKPFDMTILHHIAQALRLIASRCKAGPPILVIDDIQLLFRERVALTDRYDGIPEIFEWLLRCEVEGILDVIFCSSEKSAVGGIKRLRGYDWALKLHAVESVDDEVVIDYLLKEVNPCIQEPARKFTEETAALFVSTFDGSLLELDNYYRDTYSNVPAFIARRERSFYRRLQRHLPSRLPHSASTASIATASTSPATSVRSSTAGEFTSGTLSNEQELRELFLDITMRGGVLPVARLDAQRMRLAESLVERNILRWRDTRLRRRETRLRVASHDRCTEDAIRRRQEGQRVPRLGSAASSRAPAPVEEGRSLSASWFGAGLLPLSSAAAWGSGGEDVVEEWSHAGSRSVAADEDAVLVEEEGEGESGVEMTASRPMPEIVMDDQWAGAESVVLGTGMEEKFVRDLDAAEQLALLAMEDAELVWSNHLVRNVCEAFVSGTQLLW